MSEAYSPQAHIATWNPARGVWETEQEVICGHLEPYLATWPTSGMTHAGTAYALPTSEHPTADSASSLLPTPEAKLGPSGPDYARASRPGTGGDSLHEAVGRLAT
jgi:hypothetical protein